ncbi:MAG: dihydrodipicolinate synthase family protein [Anaerohalosphaera sp.]|nr:dihydrodipicolinate synthase family protein [Anaerohalosphaera sp.]
MNTTYTGLIAATFTPMKPDGSLNLDMVAPMVDHLIADGIKGMYVCGSTGEGPLLSTDERKATAKAHIDTAKGKLPSIIQVGHNSLTEARGLAAHAQSIEADAIAAIPPMYFKCTTVDDLVDCMAIIASAAPDTPFYYYHVPGLTGGNFDMIEFLKQGSEKIPTLAGIKYSNITLFEFQDCLHYDNGKYSLLFGCDEMLLAGLATGAPGAVGSTFNFAAPLYNRIIDAYNKGDMKLAQELQLLSVRLIKMLFGYKGQPAFKAIMKLLGIDCGPNRMPLRSLDKNEAEASERDLEAMGFFDWAR